MASSRHVTSPGPWTRARLRDRLRWLVRDVLRTAIQQVRGPTRSGASTPRATAGRAYWTRDRRGRWVLHVPITPP